MNERRGYDLGFKTLNINKFLTCTLSEPSYNFPGADRVKGLAQGPEKNLNSALPAQAEWLFCDLLAEGQCVSGCVCPYTVLIHCIEYIS